ncbi:MAG: hypothetical protein ACYC64_05020 [Armatimonadota bacterium]
MHRRLSTKSLLLTALLVALVALYFMPVLARAAGSKAKQNVENKALLHVTIALTSKGIVVTPSTLKPGNHLLTIKNSTSEPRGVEMIGIDKAASPTVRYTKILKPGATEKFRWYFATGKTVYVRDIMSCAHDQRSCMMVTFGHMTKAIDVN